MEWGDSPKGGLPLKVVVAGLPTTPPIELGGDRGA